MSATSDILLQKIRNQSPDKITEVEHFVDQLAAKSSRDELYEAIAAYADEHGGTVVDLDRDFEAAAIEHRLEGEQRRETR